MSNRSTLAGTTFSPPLLSPGYLGPIACSLALGIAWLYGPVRLEGAPTVFPPSDPTPVRPAGPYEAVLIGGQSNAVGQGELDDPEPPDPSVWMLGNDGLFKLAAEPIDSNVNQVDAVSWDPGVAPGQPRGHSWILRAAKKVAQRTRRRLMLIPAQKGGSRIEQWFPGPDRLDRQTLFGNANHRRQQAAPDGLSMIWWYGHESNSEPPFDTTYIADWTRLVAELRSDNAYLPVIYAQLAGTTEQAPLGYVGLSELLLIAAEKQRLMEWRWGSSSSLSRHFMVVTFDLPLVDYIHLNRRAVDALADRFAMATLQHVYRRRINGTGPRLLYLRHPRKDKALIKIRFNRRINQAFNDYDRQFRVYDGGIEVPIQGVERDRDPRAVLITLTKPAEGSVEVSYGGRPMPNPGVGFPHVIKDSDGLPAPQFWRLPVH